MKILYCTKYKEEQNKIRRINTLIEIERYRPDGFCYEHDQTESKRIKRVCVKCGSELVKN